MTDWAFAMEMAHARKLHTYVPRCEARGRALIPLAVDTFGRWHPMALKGILHLGRQLANLG